MIQEMQTNLEQLGNYENESIDTLKKQMRNKLKELIVKYEDLKALDKLAKAQANVKEVETIMSSNIGKMFENQAGLTVFLNMFNL